MKKITTFLLILTGFSGLVFSQTLYNLDNYIDPTQSTSPKPGLLKAQTQAQTQAATTTPTLTTGELQTIEQLSSTADVIIYRYGKVVNLAKQNNVTCVKAEADVETFLQVTTSDAEKKKVTDACRDVQLVLFLFHSQADLEQAKSLDFTILEKFPQLKYIVFYVDQTIDLSREQVESRLNALSVLPIESPTEPIKLLYRIPRGG